MCIWKMLLKKFPSIIRFRPTGDLVKFELEFKFKFEQSAGGVREVRPSALER